jgi:hypothetical protein
VKEIYEQVLSRGGRYREVHGPREKSTAPSPLKVKEVRVGERRYVVCLNEERARKDRADRQAIIEALREQLKHGDKFEWAELLRDLEALQSTQVESQGKRFLLRSDLATRTAAVFRAAGVAIPPSVQKTEE